MASFLAHYNRTKSGFSGITMRHAEEAGRDIGFAALGGAGVAVISTVGKTLDAKVGSVKIPLDGAFAVALGLLGKSLKSPELSLASAGAAGATAARLLTPIMAKNLAAHGEIEDGMSMGWGSDGESTDPLVSAAQYL